MSLAQTASTRVAISGGGPGGLMTAILLARAGVASVLFDRREWPIDKVCGEGIMPCGVALLQKHGILERIDPERSRPFQGIRYVDRDGRTAVGDFRGEPGLCVRRLALSEALHQAALEEPLVTLCSGHELVGFEESKDAVSVSVKSLSTDKRIELEGFAYLIGADGLHSKLRKLNAMDGRAPGKQPKRMGARVHVEMAPWDTRVQVWWQNGIECYVAPTSATCVEFNFGWDHDRVNPRRSEPSLEAGLFAYFPDLADRVQGRERLSKMRSWGPLPHQADSPLVGRIALMGDAYLFYDQITGEGLSLAFSQAELVASTLLGWDSPAGRAAFVEAMEKVAADYIRVTDLAMFFTRHPRIRNLAIRYLGRAPRLFAHLLHANMGEVSPFRPSLGALFQGLLPRSMAQRL